MPNETIDYAQREQEVLSEVTSPWAAAAAGAGIGCGMTCPAAILAFISAGIGHGDYVLARLIFPLTYFLAFGGSGDLPSNSWMFLIQRSAGGVAGHVTPSLIVFALAQFPTYGLLIGLWAHRGWRAAAITAAFILSLHAFVVLLCFG